MDKIQVNKMTEEEQMAVNCSTERYRMALIRAAQENKRMIKATGKSMFVLERTYLDNMINRTISSPIAVGESKDEVISFCRKLYGDDIPFNENGKTPSIEISMGEASFQIVEIAFV